MDNKKTNASEYFEPVRKSFSGTERKLSFIKIIAPVIAGGCIIAIILGYAAELKKQLIRYADYTVEQTSNRISNEITSKISYAKSSIKSVADSVSAEMTSDILEEPSEIIEPFVEHTPFELIEYIRPDGMNTMNIGQPFDASQREYYTEGIKGNSGIWVNYAPRYSKEALLNFYTTIYRNDRIVGVLTGAIGGTSQLAPLLESSFYGEMTLGFLVDSEHMVIASTTDSEFVPELRIDDILDDYCFTNEQKEGFLFLIDSGIAGSASFADPEGDARVCAAAIPDTDWYVIEIVPSASFRAVVNRNTNSALIAIGGICLVLLLYLSYILISGRTERKRITQQNLLLEEENARFDSQNKKAFEDLQEALAAADEANRAKTLFLNNMSHDIRTPMNAIIGFTNIAKSRNKDELIADYLDKISTSSEHLLNLINDVLDLSRIESGKIACHPSPCDLRDISESALAIIKGNLTGRRLELIENTDGIDKPYVMADGLRIREIIVNILSNAVKYTNDGGTITFSAETLPDTDENHTVVRYIISDTGIGMSEEFLSTIFDEFSREDNTTCVQYKGTDLGMAITKKYVDLMGGNIGIKSQKGVGSEFTVELPLELSTEKNIQECRVTSPDTDLTGIKVLIAEDNDLNAEIAVTLLEEQGLSVIRAVNGQEAADIFANSPQGTFDVILMDIMMPEMNGYDATRAIRSMSGRPDAAKIPIIAITSNAFSEDIRNALDSGMNAHLAKPIEINDVMRTIAVRIHNNYDSEVLSEKEK